MKIGLFTDTYYPQINGVVTSIKMLEKQLRRMGHQVYIFTTSYPTIKDQEETVFRLPSIPFLFCPSYRVGSIYSPKLVKTIRALQLDLIHTQTEFCLGIFASILARQLGLPLVHTYHTMYKDYVHYLAQGKNQGILPVLAKKLSKGFCNQVSRVIAPTVKVEEILKEYGVKKPISVIPSGIDLKPFLKQTHEREKIEALKSALGIPLGDPVILFIGRIAKEKSIDVLLRAMVELAKKLPRAKLLIVGDGPVKTELEDLCLQLGIQDLVIFAGEQPWADIGKYYQLGDVFVSASTTETQGLTMIEAMAAQLPVVAKYDRNLEDMITDRETGRIFQRDEDLPGILLDVLQNKEGTADLISWASKNVLNFSAEQFGERIETLYLEVLLEKENIRQVLQRKRKLFRWPLKDFL